MKAEGKEASNLKISSNLIKLNGVNSVIGRSFVIHADQDDHGKGTF